MGRHQNPINNERIISFEYQIQQWVEGNPIHNGLTRSQGECCPDFSCCEPDLLMPYEERLAYAEKKFAERASDK